MNNDQPSAPAPPPPAPSPAETSQQAIDAQINSLPKMLAAQQQYGPQFSQLNLDQLNQFGPQFAQAALNLEQQFGPQMTAAMRANSPELAGAQDTLSTFLKGDDQSDYNNLAPGILEQTRAGQSARGIGAISPLGSVDESVQLAQLKQSLQDRRLNVALSTAGRVPIGAAQPVQGTTGTGQLVQNVSPGDIFGAQASNNSYNSSIFNTQGAIYGNQLAHPSGNVFGTILGSGAGSLLGSAGVFGGARLFGY